MHALAWIVPLLWWMLFADVAAAAPILDQQHAPVGNFPALAVANDRTQIQTFTVGITGRLTRIDVQVSRGPLTVEDLVLSLWSTDGVGLPQARLVTKSAAPTDPAFTSSGPRPFIPFDLTAAGLGVSTGALLAIELNSNAANSPPFDERYLWEIGGQHNRGVAFTQIGAVLSSQGEDFHFRTFVDPVSAPATLILLSIGLIGMLACHWRYFSRAAASRGSASKAAHDGKIKLDRRVNPAPP